MEKEKVGKFYDMVWTEYIPEYKASEKHWKIFYSPEEVKGKSVLDAGCGTGIFSIIFSRNGASQVTGIDISEGSLETARRLKENFKLDNAVFKKADMLALPFPNERFDIVWAWGAVHHTLDPLKAISELMRVLKPSGSLVRTPKKTWKCLAKIMAIFLAPVIFLFKKREKSRKGESLEELIIDWYFVPIRHYYKPEDIHEFLKKRGFEVEKFLPASGRFDSTSNFIFKAIKIKF